MGIQSEKGDRSSRHALFDGEQTCRNATIHDLTPNFEFEFKIWRDVKLPAARKK
jgi:hypothetical protein